MKARVGFTRLCACRRRRTAGLTLVELLVAMSLTVIVLGAAWPCFWNARLAAGRVDARAQAETAAASALRRLAADLRVSTAVQAPPDGLDPRRALSLRQCAPRAPQEDVLVVWDEGRRVLWRKASGSYLADGVERFTVTYWTASGEAAVPADSEQWAAVRGVRVELVVRFGRERAERTMELPVGPR